MDAPPLLKASSLGVSFPIRSGFFRRITGQLTAVHDFSLEIRAGEVVGLVGESGSGKSTIARALAGLQPPTSGEILYEGKPLPKRWGAPLRRKVQILFQDPGASLNPKKSVGMLLEEVVFVHKLERGNERIVKTLEEVGLPLSSLTRYPYQFSGGQQQRICLARSLLLEPELLICDEVVSALDLSIQAQILNLLQELRQHRKLSMLFIAHNLSTVRYLCDRVMVLYLGRCLEEASTDELFRIPAHPYTRALLAAQPADHPSRRGTHSPLTGESPSPSKTIIGCPFAGRCPHAEKQCSLAAPPRKEVAAEKKNEPGHHYSCIL